jgi:hypothetical protein
MARLPGDKNYNAREDRLKAELAVKDVEIKTLKAKLKAKDARQKELRERL